MLCSQALPLCRSSCHPHCPFHCIMFWGFPSSIVQVWSLALCICWRGPSIVGVSPLSYASSVHMLLGLVLLPSCFFAFLKATSIFSLVISVAISSLWSLFVSITYAWSMSCLFKICEKCVSYFSVGISLDALLGLFFRKEYGSFSASSASLSASLSTYSLIFVIMSDLCRLLFVAYFVRSSCSPVALAWASAWRVPFLSW